MQGFRDPHLLLLARDSPVLTRVGLMTLLQVCRNNFLHKDGAWSLMSADCSSAFLQGIRFDELAQPARKLGIEIRTNTPSYVQTAC